MRFRGRSSSLCLFINLRRVAQSRVWIRRAGGGATHLIVDIQAAAGHGRSFHLRHIWTRCGRTRIDFRAHVIVCLGGYVISRF